MLLYDYFRSSASYRVRIALAYKSLEVDLQEVHLVNQGGEQHLPEYKQLNPQELVPTLCDEDFTLSQSLAIIEYLESIQPNPSLYPDDPKQKSLACQLALTTACDIHPLNNLRVLNYLKQHFSASKEAINQWYHHWLKLGFDAIEENLAVYQKVPMFCLGVTVSIADVCLIPQVYNAKRFEFCLDNYPRIEAIYQHCMSLPYFDLTKP